MSAWRRPAPNERHATHEFIFEIVLPPLLFEAALSLRWRSLSRDMAPVLLLSTLGVIVSAIVVSLGMQALLSWPSAAAMIFGLLIAATDPIAVLAMFKDSGVKGRLRLLIESESLFNDGVAAVLFSLALTATQASGAAPADAPRIALTLATMTGGGILTGLACGGGAVLFGRTHVRPSCRGGADGGRRLRLLLAGGKPEPLGRVGLCLRRPFDGQSRRAARTGWGQHSRHKGAPSSSRYGNSPLSSPIRWFFC